MKIISFNIRSMDDDNGNSIAERAPRLWRIVSSYDPDLIGLQEFTPKWEPQYARFFGKDYEIFNEYRCRTGWVESAPILWKRDRFTLLEKRSFWYSDTPDVESGGYDTLKHNRHCLVARLRENGTGKTFTFLNTHFGFGNENQVKSARILKEKTDALEGPFFITGDFNAAPSTDAYRYLISFFRDVNADDLVSPTFHGYDPAGTQTAHIDYCFVNGLVSSKNVKIVTDTVNGAFPSDHFGLYAELGLL